jgi:hypothetical protein
MQLPSFLDYSSTSDVFVDPDMLSDLSPGTREAPACSDLPTLPDSLTRLLEAPECNVEALFDFLSKHPRYKDKALDKSKVLAGPSTFKETLDESTYLSAIADVPDVTRASASAVPKFVQPKFPLSSPVPPNHPSAPFLATSEVSDRYESIWTWSKDGADVSNWGDLPVPPEPKSPSVNPPSSPDIIPPVTHTVQVTIYWSSLLIDYH